MTVLRIKCALYSLTGSHFFIDIREEGCLVRKEDVDGIECLLHGEIVYHFNLLYRKRKENQVLRQR